MTIQLKLSSGKSKAKIITYPAPITEAVLSGSYTVLVNGQQLDIYKALSPRFEGGEYYFCYFDFEGEVEVKVKSKKPFTRELWYGATPEEKAKAAKKYVGEIYPYDIKPIKKTPNEMAFKADKPFKALVLREERKMPLIIFGNPLEKDAPKKGDANVIYFDAGVHVSKEPLFLKDNQTLYIAGGAVLKMPIKVLNAKNVSIRGRGVVSLDNRERWTVGNSVVFYKCENITVKDVILKDPVDWVLVFHNSNKVLVDNVKVCAGRMINDDAIDVCNTSNVVIKDTFCRSEDDSVAIYGVWRSGVKLNRKNNPDPEHKDNNLPVENITIDNCIFWTDCANIFRMGYMCYAPYVKNIKVKNLKIPFYSTVNKIDDYWVRAIFLMQPSENLTLSNLSFEDVEIRSDGRDFHVIVAEPKIVSYGAVRVRGAKGEHGRVENVSFKNINVVGKKGNFLGRLHFKGKGENYKVKNFTLENFNYFGNKITDKSSNVTIGEYTENISFK